MDCYCAQPLLKAFFMTKRTQRLFHTLIDLLYKRSIYLLITYESISVFSDNERRMALSTSGNFSAAGCSFEQEWDSYCASINIHTCKTLKNANTLQDDIALLSKMSITHISFLVAYV
jgi:hypothetical protein